MRAEVLISIAATTVLTAAAARADDTCATAAVALEPARLQLTREMDVSGTPAISPDGTVLATAGDGGLALWDLATGASLWSSPGELVGPRWNAAGDAVLATSSDGTETVTLALADGARTHEPGRRIPIRGQADVTSAVVVADGLELRDARDRKVRLLAWPGARPVVLETIDVTPDGARIVGAVVRPDDLDAAAPSTIVTWSIDGRGQAVEVSPTTVWDAQAIPGRDALFVLGSGGSGDAAASIVPLDGSAPRELTSLAGIRRFELAADGNLVAFSEAGAWGGSDGGARTGVYDLRTDTVLWRRFGSAAMTFSTDGRWLLLAGESIVQLDVRTGRARASASTRLALVEQHPTFVSDDRLVTRSELGVTSWDLTGGVPDPARSRAISAATLDAAGGDLWVTAAELRRTDDCFVRWRVDRWKGGVPPDDLDARVAGDVDGPRLCATMWLELVDTDGPTGRVLARRDDASEIHHPDTNAQVALPGSAGALDVVLVPGGALHVNQRYDATHWTFWDDTGVAHALIPAVRWTSFARPHSAVSASGRLATAFGAQLFLFDLPDGSHAATIALDADALDVAWRGDELILAAADGTVRRLDGDGVELARSREQAEAPFAHVVVSPSGDRIVTTETGGAIRVWDPETLTTQVTLAQAIDGEWIALTPGGAIDGSADALDLVTLQFGAPVAAAPVGALASTVRRPDIVRKRLAGKAVDLALTASRAPTLTMPAPTVVDAVASVTVEVASVTGAGELQLFVEGRPAGRASYCGKLATVRLDVPVPGAARITAVAFDTGGGTSPASTADLPASVTDARPELWAVIVGIGAYDRLGPRWQLAAQHDARALGAALADMAGDGLPYAAAHVTTLIDGEATRGAVGAALGELAAMKPGDLAIVYLAGHGWRIPKKGMVLLTSEVSSKRDAAKLGISWSGIRAQLEAAPGRVLVLLDACHAGVFSQDVVVPNEELAASLARRGRSGVVVFAASKGRQFSYETGATRGHFELAVASATAVTAKRPKKKPRKQKQPAQASPAKAAPTFDPQAPVGVFTSALIGAFLDPAIDGDQDGSLQLSELVDHVTKRVSRDTDGKQTPTVSRRELFGDFTIGPLLDQRK